MRPAGRARRLVKLWAMRRIGVLTSGGDAPGMNATVRAVVRSADHAGVATTGIMDGWNGAIEGRFHALDSRSVSGILAQGGTLLGTVRSEAFYTRQGRATAATTLGQAGIDGLVVIGGMSRVPLSLPLTLTLTLVFHVLSLLHSLIAIPFVYRCARRFSFEGCGTPKAVRESTESNLGFQCRARIGRKVAIGIMVYFACAAACITAVSLGERG